MEPVSAIVGALIAGASAALNETANQAVKDAYAGLKRVLKDAYSFASLALIEKQPDNATFKDAAEAELEQSAAAEDETVLTKALEVLDAVQAADPAELAAWGVDVGTIKAGRDVLLENITGLGGGLRADQIEAVQDVTLKDIHGGPSGTKK